MKQLAAGKVEAVCAEYEVKVDEGRLEVSAKADLCALVDKAAEAVPGESAMEMLVVGLLKQAVKAL
ncbi:MAG TPA: hypothetical protein VEF04_07890 [Blastocatellia bacterium]|nr:hypothetical protein [Blastocatellia bacterium]